MSDDDTHLMTVRELRAMIADLPDDDYIAVDGYEGGYDMPRLEQHAITTPVPWVDGRSYCGAWREAYFKEPDAVDVWVLARS